MEDVIKTIFLCWRKENEFVAHGHCAMVRLREDQAEPWDGCPLNCISPSPEDISTVPRLDHE